MNLKSKPFKAVVQYNNGLIKNTKHESGSKIILSTNLHLVLSVNSHYSSSRVIKSTNAPTIYVSLIEIIPIYLGIYTVLLISSLVC